MLSWGAFFFNTNLIDEYRIPLGLNLALWYSIINGVIGGFLFRMIEILGLNMKEVRGNFQFAYVAL